MNKKETFDTLFDLIKSFKENDIAFCDCCDAVNHCDDCEAERLTNYLIEHGVCMDDKTGKAVWGCCNNVFTLQ